MSVKRSKYDIARSLDNLEEIVRWFDGQERVDIQEGLAKVREGAALVKELRTRMKAVENEFHELKKDLTTDEI